MSFPHKLNLRAEKTYKNPLSLAWAWRMINVLIPSVTLSYWDHPVHLQTYFPSIPVASPRQHLNFLGFM